MPNKHNDFIIIKEEESKFSQRNSKVSLPQPKFKHCLLKETGTSILPKTKISGKARDLEQQSRFYNEANMQNFTEIWKQTGVSRNYHIDDNLVFRVFRKRDVDQDIPASISLAFRRYSP